MRVSLVVLAAGCALAADAPQQIHVALAGADGDGNSNGMTVSWQTVNDTASSVVRYGLTEDGLVYEATGASSTYYSTYDHHVKLENLASNTQYYYSCGDDAAGFSDVLSFRTAAKPDEVEYPLNVALVGDMGVYNSEDNMALLKALKPSYELVFHIGDISYADDAFLHTPLEFNYENTWNEYMNNIQEWAAEVPYMVVEGNHEAECHSPACYTDREKMNALSNFTAYKHRFAMPNEESGGVENMWFSFNYGPVHFVAIDTETNFDGAPIDKYTLSGSDYGVSGDQLAWLEADLAEANKHRDVRPWIIVGGHRPVYSVIEYDGTDVTGTSAAVQAAFEGLFHEYGVDVFVCGHEHSYERQFPVYANTNVATSYKDAPYTVYLVQGAGGNSEGHSNYDNAASPPWSAFWDSSNYGIGMFSFEDAYTLKWQFLKGVDGSVIDEVVISKTPPST